MGLRIGTLLSLVVAIFARTVGLDRDRAFYSTILIVVASYYVLFAAIGGSPQAMIHEWIGMSVFLIIAVVGFKLNMWFIVSGLIGHGIFDFFHAHLVTNAGVPEWWPAFCGSYDVGAGLCLAWLLIRAKAAARKA
jgi:hypothetical protein